MSANGSGNGLKVLSQHAVEEAMLGCGYKTAVFYETVPPPLYINPADIKMPKERGRLLTLKFPARAPKNIIAKETLDDPKKLSDLLQRVFLMARMLQTRMLMTILTADEELSAPPGSLLATYRDRITVKQISPPLLETYKGRVGEATYEWSNGEEGPEGAAVFFGAKTLVGSAAGLYKELGCNALAGPAAAPYIENLKTLIIEASGPAPERSSPVATLQGQQPLSGLRCG
ncbi:MAG: hypothetical protein WDO70_00870 [Alphaproteobacteria bacterium]